MVTLEEHPGRLADPVSGELVPAHPGHRQILVDGVRVGYCGARPGMPITLIVRMPETAQDSIRRFVEEHVGAVSRVSQPPEIIDEEDAEEE